MPVKIVYPWNTLDGNFNTDWELAFSNGVSQTGTMNLYTGTGNDPAPGFPNSSHPVHWTLLGNKLLFQATNNANGRELFITDGTVAGTGLLKDINTTAPTASNDSFDRFGSWNFQSAQQAKISAPINFDGFVYFSANNGPNGFELWRSDGTAAGTVLVKNINTTGGANGPNSSYPQQFTIVNDKLFFVADNGANGSELWVTNGTAAGTQMVKDIRTGVDPNNPPSPASGNVFGLTNVNGKLFFTADNGTNGGELWVSDGTAAGTVMLKNIVTWSPQNNGTDQGSNPGGFVVMNGIVYFGASDEGTPPPNSQYPPSHGYELWRSDGTAAGTYMAANINTQSTGNPDGPQDGGGGPFALTVLKDKLIFGANDGINGHEPYVYTPGFGATMLRNINTSPNPPNSNTPFNYGSLYGDGGFTVVGDYAYFSASNLGGGQNQELWRTDGTGIGTQMVKDINVAFPSSGSSPSNMQNVGGTLFFSALDGNQQGAYKLFKSDGTANGTVAVAADYGYGAGNNNFGWIPSVVPHNDFNGDGKGDLLFRNVNTGDVSEWQMNGLSVITAKVAANAPTVWQIQATGDFNGDGRADIFWQNTQTGDVSMWQMTGTTVQLGQVVASAVPLAWQVQATGDFNGDGKSDVLWRNTQTGDVSGWIMNGTQVTQGAVIAQAVPLTWQVQDTGDFNGDGRSDVLWRNTQTGDVSVWLMNGLSVSTGQVISSAVPLAWQVQGTGDFNGDGRADILWRNTQTGDVSEWVMNGVNITSAQVISNAVPLAWQVADIADYTMDGKADIAWRNNQTGDVSEWVMNGLNITSAQVVSTAVPLEWQIFH